MPDQPTHRTAHEAHDAELIAALADDSLTATERTKATELVATCPECAELLTDLRSIMAATSALPVPARTRDFRLTEEDARRLRPGGWRQLIAFLAGPRLAFTQPLAAGLTTLGLAGLLLFSLQGFASLGSSALAPLSKTGNPVPQAAASSQPTSQPGPAAAPAAGGVPAPSGSQTRVAGEFSTNSPSPAASAAPSSATDARNSASGPPATDSGAGTGNSGGASSEGGPNMQAFGSEQGRGLPPLVFFSGLAILVGLGLFVLRWTARRLSDA
jgi:anti-sigma factor RsiW